MQIMSKFWNNVSNRSVFTQFKYSYPLTLQAPCSTILKRNLLLSASQFMLAEKINTCKGCRDWQALDVSMASNIGGNIIYKFSYSPWQKKRNAINRD